MDGEGDEVEDLDQLKRLSQHRQVEFNMDQDNYNSRKTNFDQKFSST